MVDVFIDSQSWITYDTAISKRDRQREKRKRRAARRPAQPAAAPMTIGPYQTLVNMQPNVTPQQLRAQRVDLIQKIQQRRGRPLVIYATNTAIAQPRITNYLHREDIVPFSEMLDTAKGDVVDILLETPGGLAEVTVEIVNLLRPRFNHVAFIVPHTAMSAGTILAMSGDEILMDHRSSLGAIDPQFQGADGRLQPAQAIIQGLETIKADVKNNGGALNPVYIPILRNVDPGKLQSAINASQLSIDLVTNWLVTYKFRNWTIHSSNGNPVTDDERRERAQEIAKALCDHQRWLSHGRPIKLADLQQLRLHITDYGQTPDLQTEIWALWVNIHFAFSTSNIYKTYESETADVIKVALEQAPAAAVPAGPGKALVDVKCDTCGSAYKLQADFGGTQPLEAGAEAFPKNCMLICRKCGKVLNLTGLKMSLEAQLRRPMTL